MTSMFDINPHNRPIAARIQQAIDKVQPRLPEVISLALHRVVNEERARLGKGPIALDLCERADNCAAGHVDYRSKVAIYGEDLVTDGKPNQWWYL